MHFSRLKFHQRNFKIRRNKLVLRTMSLGLILTLEQLFFLYFSYMYFQAETWKSHKEKEMKKFSEDKSELKCNHSRTRPALVTISIVKPRLRCHSNSSIKSFHLEQFYENHCRPVCITPIEVTDLGLMTYRTLRIKSTDCSLTSNMMSQGSH